MNAEQARFLLDEHVHAGLTNALHEHGMDVRHVLGTYVEGASDPEVLEFARREGRILLTRDYRDFAILAREYEKREISFPGILFIPASIWQADVGAHAHAVVDWVESEASAMGQVTGTYGWLAPPGPAD